VGTSSGPQRRRGRVLGVDALGKSQIVRCQVPLARSSAIPPIFVRSPPAAAVYNEGVPLRGDPAVIAEKVIAESKKEMGKEEEE